MPRPQTVVTVTPALPRRGNDSDTGRTLLVYAGGTGSTNATRIRSTAEATATGAPTPIVTLVGDALVQGSPEVVLLRATAANATAVTEAEWKAALAKLGDEFGPGQVIIPGVATSAAYAALLDHAATHADRSIILDVDPAATNAVAVVTTITALAAAPGAKRGTFATPVTLPGPGGTTRDVPGSVVVAGLAGRGDAIAGHANQAPIFDQGRGAGYVLGAVGVPKLYTDADVDALYDAGVAVIRPFRGVIQLTGWPSFSDDARFAQLNWGRGVMELTSRLSGLAAQFLGRQLDGRGLLYSELEGVLRGELAEYWRKGALYGDEADDAFDVEVAAVNNDTTAAAGQLRASIAVALSAHTEKVIFDLVTYTTEGIPA